MVPLLLPFPVSDCYCVSYESARAAAKVGFDETLKWALRKTPGFKGIGEFGPSTEGEDGTPAPSQAVKLAVVAGCCYLALLSTTRSQKLEASTKLLAVVRRGFRFLRLDTLLESCVFGPPRRLRESDEEVSRSAKALRRLARSPADPRPRPGAEEAQRAPARARQLGLRGRDLARRRVVASIEELFFSAIRPGPVRERVGAQCDARSRTSATKVP